MHKKRKDHFIKKNFGMIYPQQVELSRTSAELLLKFKAEIEVKEGKFSSAEFLIHRNSKIFFVN